MPISLCAGADQKRPLARLAPRRAGLRQPRRQRGSAGSGSGGIGSTPCATRTILHGTSITFTSTRSNTSTRCGCGTGRTPRFAAGCRSAPIPRTGRATLATTSAASVKGDGFRLQSQPILHLLISLLRLAGGLSPLDV